MLAEVTDTAERVTSGAPATFGQQARQNADAFRQRLFKQLVRCPELSGQISDTPEKQRETGKKVQARAKVGTQSHPVSEPLCQESWIRGRWQSSG
jgi:hypothetical protein